MQSKRSQSKKCQCRLVGREIIKQESERQERTRQETTKRETTKRETIKKEKIKQLVNDQTGSITLEGALIFPIVLLITVSLVFTVIHTYNQNVAEVKQLVEVNDWQTSAAQVKHMDRVMQIEMISDVVDSMSITRQAKMSLDSLVQGLIQRLETY